MIRKMKKRLPYLLIIILCFYLLPLFMNDTGSGMLLLLFIFPIVVGLTSGIYGYKIQKIDLMYTSLIILLFIPVIFIYLNSSAFIYVLIYSVISILLNIIGKKLNINNKK